MLDTGFVTPKPVNASAVRAVYPVPGGPAGSGFGPRQEM